MNQALSYLVWVGIPLATSGCLSSPTIALSLPVCSRNPVFSTQPTCAPAGISWAWEWPVLAALEPSLFGRVAAALYSLAASFCPLSLPARGEGSQGEGNILIVPYWGSRSHPEFLFAPTHSTWLCGDGAILVVWYLPSTFSRYSVRTVPHVNVFHVYVGGGEHHVLLFYRLDLSLSSQRLDSRNLYRVDPYIQTGSEMRTLVKLDTWHSVLEMQER